MRPMRASEAGVLVGVAWSVMLWQVVGCTYPADYYLIVEGCPPGNTCSPRPSYDVPPPPPPDTDDYPDATPVDTTAPVPFGTTLRELDYRVVDATIDVRSGQIVVVSDVPQQLIVIAPDGRTETRTPLPAKPNAVSVSADGRLAAIGYDVGISVVQLDTGTSSPLCTQATDVRQVAITNGARVFALSQAGGETPYGGLRALDGNTCTMLTGAGSGQDSSIALTRSERSLYHNHGFCVRCAVDASSATGIQNCELTDVFAPGERLWLERGETELYTSTGERYRLFETEQESHSEQAAGRLAEVERVDAMSASAAANRVAVLGRNRAEYSLEGTRVLRIYDSQFLDLRATYGLPSLPSASYGAPAYGRFVFLDTTLRHALVFVQSAPGSGARHEFGLARLTLPGGTSDAGDAEDAGDAAASEGGAGADADAASP